MIFRIMTKQGAVIDVGNLPPDFSFFTTCGNIRLNGVFQNENFCIAWDNISFLAFGSESQMVAMAVGNAPTSGTKQ